jgi:hypothetical protein
MFGYNVTSMVGLIVELQACKSMMRILTLENVSHKVYSTEDICWNGDIGHVFHGPM